MHRPGNRPLVVNKSQLQEYVTLIGSIKISLANSPTVEYFAPVTPVIDAPSVRLINHRNYRVRSLIINDTTEIYFRSVLIAKKIVRAWYGHEDGECNL